MWQQLNLDIRFTEEILVNVSEKFFFSERVLSSESLLPSKRSFDYITARAEVTKKRMICTIEE